MATSVSAMARLGRVRYCGRERPLTIVRGIAWSDARRESARGATILQVSSAEGRRGWIRNRNRFLEIERLLPAFSA